MEVRTPALGSACEVATVSATDMNVDLGIRCSRQTEHVKDLGKNFQMLESQLLTPYILTIYGKLKIPKFIYPPGYSRIQRIFHLFTPFA